MIPKLKQLIVYNFLAGLVNNGNIPNGALTDASKLTKSQSIIFGRKRHSPLVIKKSGTTGSLKSRIICARQVRN